MIFGKRAAALAAALAVAATVGACSSSGGGTSDTSGASGGASQQAGSGGSGSTAAGSAIKLGVVCSCSGPFGASHQPPVKVAQAWAKAVNAAGGINGHPVQLTVKDDQSNPGTAVTTAQSLVSEHVSAIIDLSVLAAAWEKTVSAAKIPVIGGNMTAPQYYQDPDFYPAGQTDESVATADVLTAKLAGATNFGQLYCAESPQCQEGVPLHKAAGKKVGVPVTYSASIAATAPNYTAQCLAAKQAGVKALFVGHSAEVFAHVAEDCARQGYNPVYVEQGTGFNTLLTKSGALKNSLWADFSVLPYFADKPAVQRMNKAVDKYYPGLRHDSQWNQLGAETWAGGVLIEKAVQASGVQAGDTINAATLIKGLDSLKNETLDGWSPPLTFTAGKPHSVDCWFTGRILNGKAVLANDGKLSCQNGASS